MLTALEHVRLMRANDATQLFLFDTLTYRVYNEKRLEKIEVDKQDIVLAVSLVSERLRNDPNFPVYLRKIGLSKYPEGIDESTMYACELLHDHLKGGEAVEHESEDLWLLYENSLGRAAIRGDGSLAIDVGSNENLYMLLLLLVMVRRRYVKSASNEKKFLAGLASRMHQTSMRLTEPGKGFLESRFLSLWNKLIGKSYVRSYRVETGGMREAPWFLFASFDGEECNKFSDCREAISAGSLYILPEEGSYGNRNLVYRTDDRRPGDTTLVYRYFSIESGGTFEFANHFFSLDEERITVSFAVLNYRSVVVFALGEPRKENGGRRNWYTMSTDGRSWLRCKFSRPPKNAEKTAFFDRNFKSDLRPTDLFLIADDVVRVLEPEKEFTVFSDVNALRAASAVHFEVIGADSTASRNPTVYRDSTASRNLALDRDSTASRNLAVYRDSTSSRNPTVDRDSTASASESADFEKPAKPLLLFNRDSVLQTYDQPLLQFYGGAQFVQEPQNRLLIYGRTGKIKLVS